MSETRPSGLSAVFRWVTLLLVVLLLLLIVASGLAAWLDWEQYRGLKACEASGWRGLWYESKTPPDFAYLRWVGELLLAVAASALLMAWYALAAAQVRRAGGRGPGSWVVMSVVWWFIPLANLVMPAVLMARFVRGSRNKRAIGSVALTVLWWLLWVVAAMAMNAGVAIMFKDPGGNEYIVLTEWFLIGDAAAIVGNALAIVLICVVQARLLTISRSEEVG